MKAPRLALILVTLTSLAFLPGCDEDKKVAEIAVESAKRQAAQNEEMARVVQAGAKTTEKVLTVQHELDSQRGQLEAERQSLANSRTRESIIGSLITAGGWLLVSSLPLVLCWYLLHGLQRGGDDVELGNLLLEEITSDRPVLLPPSPQSPSGDLSPARTALESATDPRETPAR
jgi:hypothetical protein